MQPRTRKGGSRVVISLLGMVCLAASPIQLQAGAFLQPGAVVHVPNYTGTGGNITVSVCIDPADPNAAALVTPVQNAVSAFNALAPVQSNLKFGASNNIPATSVDFESAILHELGHCLGLGHTNLATESGLPEAEQNATAAVVGANTTFDVDAGVDALFGSSDDVRGDDVNLHLYEANVNNPFLMPAKVDSSTYRRTGSLPVGHQFPVNADRQVGALLGFADTEAVMQQGTFSDEAQRALACDDAATLMYAGTGYDETAGTADDYTVELLYVGLTTACDISVVPSTSGFAACQVSLSGTVTNHWTITNGTINYNSTITEWFFNPDLACLDITLDWPHNQMLRHSVCGDIDLANGFVVGATGVVVLEAETVRFENGTSIADGGRLSVINP